MKEITHLLHCIAFHLKTVWK